MGTHCDSRVLSPDVLPVVYACDPTVPPPHTHTQRAHQNSLENEPIFLALLTISGLQVSG